MASRRRSAEDKNTKLLRELATISYNKQCFDCLQRGPTYINVTIGSFVCTTCSGILRGLTPPHRVKSISMTTFTPEEIEVLKSRGNEYCKYVWLGTFDTQSNSIENEVSDDQRKRDFMVQKYEKKRWYVDPDIAVKKLQSDSLLRQKQGISVPQTQPFISKSNLPATQPLSRLLGKSPTPLVVHNNQQPTESWPHPVSSASAPTISTKTTAPNIGLHSNRSFDLLSEFGDSSTAPAQNKGKDFSFPLKTVKEHQDTTTTTSSTANGNFANFANFDNAFNSAEKSAPGMPTSTSLDAYPKPASKNPAPVFNPPPSSSLQTLSPSSGDDRQVMTDRYAALAQLDNLFNQPAANANKTSVWTVETSAAHELPMISERSSYTTAPSNPFASNDIWSHHPTPVQNSFQAANPFHAATENSAPFAQPMSNQGYTPFSVPLVGNSPSEDDVRSQFNANFGGFPTQMVTSPTNGYGSSPMMFQNGGIVSPTSTSGPWNMPMWNSSQVAQGGLFGNDNKMIDTAQHTDWIQNPVNPFMVSNNMEYPAVMRNSSNPFL